MTQAQEDLENPTFVIPAKSKRSRKSALQIEAARVESAAIAHKVEVLGNLLALSRMEEQVFPEGFNSEAGSYTYVSALSPEAHKIIAGKLIELVKKF